MCDKIFATFCGLILFLLGYGAGFLYRDMFCDNNTREKDVDLETEYDYNIFDEETRR